jgi:RND superfamily putative drug exporter
VFEDDPFSRGSIRRLDQLERHLATALSANGAGRRLAPPGEGAHPAPPSFRESGQTDDSLLAGSKLLFIGPTASIRDLKAVTSRDQIRIDVLVVASVFLVLVVLLRRIAISAYLIATVFFSYLVALGVTFVAFWMIDPSGFAGLDWKVPMFLFTILIAVGEDYNIYLMTRIDEEEREHGPVRGVIVALKKTGGIISSCGLIMAGTFSSLLSGSLAGMHQLGFALAFGVMLDTFVVRSILVPAYLILLHSGRLGPLGRLLGAKSDRDTSKTRRSKAAEPTAASRHGR